MNPLCIECCKVRSLAGETNCYLIADPEEKQALIIDPAGEAEFLQKQIEAFQVTPLAILLTHAHYDHIAAMEKLKNTYRVPIYCDMADRELMSYSIRLLNHYHQPISPCVDHWMDGSETLRFGKIFAELIPTPGHSMGSVCYYFPAAETLISGDSLFCGSVGRTDFREPEMRGSHEQLMESLKHLMARLPDAVKVLPGHGSATTIGRERKYNPFLKNSGDFHA